MARHNLEPGRGPSTSRVRRTEFSPGLDSPAQTDEKACNSPFGPVRSAASPRLMRPATGKKDGVFDVTKIWKKLQHPFALGVQGFLAGGLLFWTTRADAATVLAAIF